MIMVKHLLRLVFQLNIVILANCASLLAVFLYWLYTIHRDSR